MASWVTCTIRPENPDGIDELRDELMTSIPEQFDDCVRSLGGETPKLQYEEHWDALCVDLVPVTARTTDDVRQAAQQWIRPYASSINVAYIASVNNTSHDVAIDVFESSNGSLDHLDTVAGILKVHPLRGGEGEEFPESALILYEEGAGTATADPPPDEICNKLEELHERFGIRPILNF